MSLQVRQRSAHANKVIHQHINKPRLYGSVKFGLARQSPKSVCTSMRHDINLNDALVHRPTKNLTQLVRKDFRNGIDAFALKRMSADQGWLGTTRNTTQLQRTLPTKSIEHQGSCRIVVTGFGCDISRMLFNSRLGGVDQHFREVTPCGTRRFAGR